MQDERFQAVLTPCTLNVRFVPESENGMCVTLFDIKVWHDLEYPFAGGVSLQTCKHRKSGFTLGVWT